jgi:hypothetical protein
MLPIVGTRQTVSPAACQAIVAAGHFGFAMQNLHHYALPEIRSFSARKDDPWLESCHQ